MQIKVDCYSGYRGEETPRILWMATQKIEVKKVIDFLKNEMGVNKSVHNPNFFEACAKAKHLMTCPIPISVSASAR